MLRSFVALAALGLAAAAGHAQLVAEDPDWKEQEAPRPPAVTTKGLIPLDIRTGSLRVGVDPASISVGDDRIVRYVVVAASPTGTVNAMYEGLRCRTGEVKVYARHNPDSGWVPAPNADWEPLHEQRNTRHSLHIARAGACREHAPNGSPEQIVRDLRAPVDMRFVN